MVKTQLALQFSGLLFFYKAPKRSSDQPVLSVHTSFGNTIFEKIKFIGNQ